MKKIHIILALSMFSLQAFAGTLDVVKKRGQVICGIAGDRTGFSAPNNKGKMVGIDADFCYALSTAIFGVPNKAKFVPVNSKERFTALASGELDVLTRNATISLTRDSTLGLNFTYYNYIDGQGFMVKKSLKVNSLKQLNGARICVEQGTTTEASLADYFRLHNMKFTPVGFESTVQSKVAYDKGVCDAATADISRLIGVRTELSKPNENIILPEVISKEPLGPMVRQGDDQWGNLVRWVLYALINAEDLGITSKNIESMLKSKNPNIKRFVGEEGNLNLGLGMSKRWAYNIIKAVGNFGEIYKRNLEPLGVKRAGSLNALWSKGGIIYAPPMR